MMVGTTMSINISCADCNAIRPFSGGPPNWKCEACGCELGSPSRRPIKRKAFSGLEGWLGDVFSGFGTAITFLIWLGALWAFLALVKWFWYHS
jgi:hypothetical protein